MRNFFNNCIEKGYIDKNPCAGVKKLNELSRLKTLSYDDIQKLIAGATNKLTKSLISFLIYTGCRKGEVLNLKWENVDLKNDVVAIKGTKTKHDRYIPISGPLKELLKGIEKKAGCLYVFNNAGKKLSISNILSRPSTVMQGLRTYASTTCGTYSRAKWL